MNLFKHGGTCATIVSGLKLKLHQFQRRRAIEAARNDIKHDDVLACRHRMAEERGKAVRALGTDYILHPDNQGVPWGNKQHYSARLTTEQLAHDTLEALQC